MVGETISRGFHSPELFKVGFTLLRDMKHFSEKIDADNAVILREHGAGTWLKLYGQRLPPKKIEYRQYCHAGPGWEISLKYIPFTLPGFLRIQNLRERCRVLLPSFQIFPDELQAATCEHDHEMAIVAYIEVKKHGEQNPLGSTNTTVEKIEGQLYLCCLPVEK